MRNIRLHRSVRVLGELGVLFLASIPAYLWLFPAVEGTGWEDPVNVLVYLYVLAGTLWIGRRRWSWTELGLNRRGIGLSLAWGAVFLLEHPLAQLGMGLPLGLRPFDLRRAAWEIFFYFGMVGFVEELLFRGLVYRALEEWGGTRLAIFGSSLGFALWHVGWAGAFAAAHFFIGVLFALIRWRAGGIVGLIFIHGLQDILTLEMSQSLAIEALEDIQNLTVVHPWALVMGDALLVGLVVWLWLDWKRSARARPG